MDKIDSSAKEKLLPTADKSLSSGISKVYEKAPKSAKGGCSHNEPIPRKTFSSLDGGAHSDTSSSHESSRMLLQSHASRCYQQQQVLWGNLDKVARPKHALVCIYFSSNPQDSSHEREIIWKQSVPSLRKHCRDLYDIELQVVDLNAGIAEGIVESKERRLSNIERCQEVSLSTAFVSLISHKYWTPSLPAVIEAQLFETLLKVAYHSRLLNCRLLEECYERDENALPPSYVLKYESQEIYSQLSDVSSNEVGAQSKAFLLQNLLRDSAVHALNSKNISPEQADVFLISYIEEEIRKGLLTDSEYNASKSICYIRTIDSMETDMNYRRVYKYVDVLPSKGTTQVYVTDNLLDHFAQTKLAAIRENMLPGKVVSSEGRVRVYKCAVKWKPQVGLSSESHSEYLNDFNSHLQYVVQKMTARGASQLRNCNSLEHHEASCHVFLAKSLNKSLLDIGQRELSCVKDYFAKSSNPYCVLHGSNGSGKTRLIATIASEFREWIEPGSKPVCVVRFLGETFLSSYAVPLLDSVSSQLEHCIDDAKQSESSMWCTDVVFQKKRLETLLQQATADRPIIVLLDGLERLADPEEPDSLLSWLPTELPDHVKFVVTTNSNSSCCQQLWKNFGNSQASFIAIDSLSRAHSSKLLQRMLASNNRQITSGQLVFALQSLTKRNSRERVISPCLLSLVYMHAINWKSSKDVNEDTIGVGAVDAVQRYIVELQRKYGAYFVRATVGLIGASKFGVTEQELEEILLGIGSVIGDVKSLHVARSSVESGKNVTTHDVRGALANALRNLLVDLSPLLIDKLFVGCLMFTWSNSVVQSAMESIYQDNLEHKREMQKLLLRYYSEYVDAGKYPSNQEAPFKTAHIAIELPFHLKDMGRETAALEFCFLNVHWLAALLKTFGVVPVLFYLELAYKWHSSNRPLLIVERSIRLSIPTLQCNLRTLPGELYGRTLPFAKIFPPLKAFVTQCAACKLSTPYLHPAGVHAQAPGAPLRVSFVEEEPIVGHILAYGSGEMSNLVYCTGNRLKFFDLFTGDSLREIAFRDRVKWLRITKDKQFILVMSFDSTLHSLCILNEKTSVHKTICLEDVIDFDSDLKSEEELDSTVSNVLLAIWARQQAQCVFLFEIKSGKLLHQLASDESSQFDSCLISLDEQFLYVISLPHMITVFSTLTGRKLHTLLPATISATSHIVNLFEGLNNALLGVYSSGYVHVWGKSQKEGLSHLFELDSRSSSATDLSSVVHSSMSEDRDWLVVVKPLEIDVWDLKEWKTSREIASRKDELFASAYFCNGQKYLLVLLAGSELGICVWDLTSDTPTCVSILDGHSAPIKEIIVPNFKSASPLAPWIVTSSSDDTIKVWNLENIPLIPTLTTTRRPISKVFLAGNFTVTSDGSDVVTVWRTSNVDILMRLKHSAPVTHVAVANWSLKVVTADEKNFQYVWNLRNGENTIKILGPEILHLVVSPNDQLVISIFPSANQPEPQREASKIWKLDSGHVVCTFDYTLESPQVTSNNTFLVGISLDRKLIAISLWTGKLTKVLCRASASIILIHALSWHDHVISIDSHNFVTVWNIAEETSLMSLDMKNTIMKEVCVCDSGSVMATSDGKENMKVLDVAHGKLRKVETFGSPIMTRLTSDGLYLVQVSLEEMKNKDDDVTDVKYHLVIVDLSGNNSFFAYPLEGVPTSMEVAKSGKSVAVGLAEGRPVVFNIIEKDSKPSRPIEYKFKRAERSVFLPKQEPDQMWFPHKPAYHESFIPGQGHSTFSSAERQQYQGKSTMPDGISPAKFSIHLPRKKSDADGHKPKTMYRLGNKSSKVKVFM